MRILEFFEELDESGARVDRPLLRLALEGVEPGASRGLVVASIVNSSEAPTSAKSVPTAITPSQ